jgi:hypothetical protein
MQEQIAKTRRKAREQVYDPEPFISRLEGLRKSHSESFREASLRAGLDHQTIRRILTMWQVVVLASRE